MNHLSRLGTLTLLAGGVLSASCVYAAAANLLARANPSSLLLSSSSQGYLGVGVMDVDSDRASTLKLKEARGAEIITIDQDAPAAKAGLRVHDVVTQMNGQRVEGVEQFRRMLRETPPGRTVSLVAIRDGQAVNLSAQLADRAAIAKGIIVGLGDLPSVPDGSIADATTQDLPSSGNSGKKSHSRASSFLEPFSRNRYYVGVDVQPLPTGLAEYFGVRGGSGLLVGNVFPHSPGAAAGLKAADVIQKVNGQPIVSLSDWERAIRANRGKQVQVTVIRDKKEQTLSMVAGEAKNSSELKWPTLGPLDPSMIAQPESGIRSYMME